MLRFKESHIWKELTFHFRCRESLRLAEVSKRALYKEMDHLRTQIEEAKAVFDAMDTKHIADKEVMAKEIEQMREEYLKLRGECDLAVAESKATTKYAYDARKATENLQAERQHLLGLVDGLREDFKQYKEGAKSIEARGEGLAARIEANHEANGTEGYKYTTIMDENGSPDEVLLMTRSGQIVKRFPVDGAMLNKVESSMEDNGEEVDGAEEELRKSILLRREKSIVVQEDKEQEALNMLKWAKDKEELALHLQGGPLECPTMLQEAKEISEQAKKILESINQSSMSPTPFNEKHLEAYYLERAQMAAEDKANGVLPVALEASPEHFNRKKRRKVKR